MLKLHMVQAEHGDCFILEYGTPSSPKHILIDGGPAAIYEKHLRAKLIEIKAGRGSLDLAVLSHVDDDHIVGLLDFMKELEQQRASNASETATPASLWHNTFSQTLGKDVEDRFRSVMRGLSSTRQSVPNLSSIMFLAKADGKTILFTGDGLGDQLIQGLQQARLLDPDGRLHVNVLKLPHHGSQRNVKQSFFEAVTADQYVISANGRNGNPDLVTLKWIVETARATARKIELIVTNKTDSTQQLVNACPPNVYGYQLTEMEPGAHAMTLELAS